MCSQKNCKALAPPPGSGLPGWRVPGEPETRLPSGADSGFHFSVPEHARAADRTTVTDSGDRASPNPLRLPEDSSAAEAGGLEGRQKAGVSSVL